MTTPCAYHARLLEALEDHHNIAPEMRAHLAKCQECRQEAHRYGLLVEALVHRQIDKAMAEAETKGDLPSEPLPANLLELVNQRKKNWLRERLKKNLGAQGITDKKEQQQHLDRLLHESPADLPLAASPDDLHEDDEQ